MLGLLKIKMTMTRGLKQHVCKQHREFFKPHCARFESKKYMKESPTNLERTCGKNNMKKKKTIR